jgi:outer membrane autotransporter protein
VFQADLGSYWAEVEGGLTHQMSKISALYANVGYQWNLDHDTHAWTGKVGVRINW